MRLSHMVLCLAFAAPAASANELMRVYDLAVTNDPTLAAAAHGRDAGIEATPVARGALLPQINAGYQDGRQNQETTSKSGPCNFTTLATTCSTSFKTSGYSVTLDQALFNWESIQRWRQAGDQAALAEAGYRGAEQGLALRTAQAYFGVLAAADDLRFADAQNKAVERQLEQSKKRFEVGLSAITDVQEAQARYDLTVAQQITAQQALDSAKEGLSTITGQPSDRFISLQEDIPLPAPDPADVKAWIDAARENNLDLLSAKLTAEIAGKGVSIAKARHLPTAGVQAQYQNGSQGGRFAADQTTKSVTLNVNVPIFAGGATQAGVNSAEATHEQRVAEYEARKRLVDKQTRDAYQGVLAGASQVKAYKQAVLSSSTALEASETGLQVGARTAIDVLNAQQQVFDAQRNYSKARYNYLLSVLTLKSAAGRLAAPDLAEIDRLLVQ